MWKRCTLMLACAVWWMGSGQAHAQFGLMVSPSKVQVKSQGGSLVLHVEGRFVMVNLKCGQFESEVQTKTHIDLVCPQGQEDNCRAKWESSFFKASKAGDCVVLSQQLTADSVGHSNAFVPDAYAGSRDGQWGSCRSLKEWSHFVKPKVHRLEDYRPHEVKGSRPQMNVMPRRFYGSSSRHAMPLTAGSGAPAASQAPPQGGLGCSAMGGSPPPLSPWMALAGLGLLLLGRRRS